MSEPVDARGIGIGEGASSTTSLKDALLSLRQSGTETGQSTTKTFEINPRIHPIQPADLRQLVTFPFEFGLSERDGNILVATGSESHAPMPDDPNTTIDAHSHRDTSSNTFLSFSDIFVSDRPGPKAQKMLITKNGIIVFKRPQFDPLRKIPTNEAVTNLMSEYGTPRGVNIPQVTEEEGLTDISDLPEAEQHQLARDFARDTGMIVMEVGWSDEPGIKKIVDAINQKTVISDNAEAKPPSVLDDSGIDLDTLGIDISVRSAIDELIGLMNGLKNRKGRQLNDKSIRLRRKDYTTKLIDALTTKNPSGNIAQVLPKLRQILEGIDID